MADIVLILARILSETSKKAVLKCTAEQDAAMEEADTKEKGTKAARR